MPQCPPLPVPVQDLPSDLQLNQDDLDLRVKLALNTLYWDLDASAAHAASAITRLSSKHLSEALQLVFTQRSGGLQFHEMQGEALLTYLELMAQELRGLAPKLSHHLLSTVQQVRDSPQRQHLPALHHTDKDWHILSYRPVTDQERLVCGVFSNIKAAEQAAEQVLLELCGEEASLRWRLAPSIWGVDAQRMEHGPFEFHITSLPAWQLFMPVPAPEERIETSP